MEKYMRGMFNWILGIVGFTFFISLYFDDFTLHNLQRGIMDTSIPLILPGDSKEKILQKMKKYSEVVQKHCKELQARGFYKYKMDNPEATANVNMVVSDKYKFMACKAAGVAGSNVHRIVYALHNNLKDANVVTSTIARSQVSNLMLNSVNAKERTRKLKQYTKFMLFRDPLERLLSAYRAEQPQTLWSGAVEPNFKSYLTKYLSAAHPMVPSWRELWRLCNPCEINYDYILPLSIFNEGIAAILTELKVPNITLPTREWTDYKTKSSQQVKNLFYNSVPENFKQKLREKCKVDYFLFYGKKYF